MTTSSGSIPKHGSPSFFKVIRDPSSPHLMLPSAFVRRHLKKIPKNPILKTVTGEHSWRLKIEKIDGDYCFALGWNKLVQDFNLCLGDFLVFWLIDSSTFKVLIFHRDGCEKDPNWEPGINIDDDDDELDDDDDELDDYDVDGGDDDEKDADYVDDGIRDENPCFQRAISEKTHKYTMRLPRVFVEEAGIENKSLVTIKDLEGREWLVGLFVERYKSNKYILSSGWSIFREYNKLSEGDICLFKFIKKEGVLYLAQLIKNKNARKEEIREENILDADGVKRKRGRPPLEKPRGGVNRGGVKIEYESDLEVEVVKRKRGRPPREKRRGGVGGVVNTQMDVDKRKKEKSPLEKRVGGVGDCVNTEMEVEKRERGRLSLEKHRGGGGGGGVNTKVEVDKRKRGRPPLGKGEGGGGDGGGVNIEMELEKRKRERPPLEKHGGGVGDGANTEMEVEKRKRGRPPLEKSSGGGGGGGGVKTEVEVEKRKRGRPPLEKHRGGGVNIEMEVEKKKRDKPPLEKPHVDVKVEDESSPDVEVIKRKRGRPSLKKPCVEVKLEDESTSDVEATRRKRGRPRLDSYDSSNRVIYF